MSRFKVPHVEEPSLRVRALRYFMTIFCLFFFVFGISVIVCGSILVSQQAEDCGWLSQFYIGIYMLLAAGCTTSFFSLLACMCAQRSSTSHEFVPLTVVVIVVVGLQIMAAVASHVSYTSAASGGLASRMTTAWQDYHDGGTVCVDGLQETLECCGVHNHTEWVLVDSESTSPSLSSTAPPSSSYPQSCMCASDVSQCVLTNHSLTNATRSYNVHDTPCHNALLDQLYETLLIPRIVGPVVSLVELVFLLAVIYFLNHINNHSLVGAYVVQPTGDSSPAGCESERCSSTGTELQVRQSAVDHRRVCQQDSLSLSRDETIMHV